MRLLIVSMQGLDDIGANGTILRALYKRSGQLGGSVCVACERMPYAAKSTTPREGAQRVVCWHSLLLNRLRVGTVTRLLQVPATVLLIVLTVRKFKPNVIIGLYPRERMLFCGLLASLLTGVPYVSWFHDLYSGYVRGLRRSAANLIEPIVLRHSRVNAGLTAGLVKWYEEKYQKKQPRKWIYLPHPIILEEFDHVPTPEVKREEQPTVLFCGTIYDNCLPNLVTLARVLQETAYKIHIITPHVEVARRIFHDIEPQARVRITIGLERNWIIAEMKKAEVLFLPLTFSPDFPQDELRTVFPTKAVEYLFSGSMILVNAPSNTHLVEEMRAQDGVLICDSDDASRLKHELARAVALAREFRVQRRLPERDLSKFYAENVLRQLEQYAQ